MNREEQEKIYEAVKAHKLGYWPEGKIHRYYRDMTREELVAAITWAEAEGYYQPAINALKNHLGLREGPLATIPTAQQVASTLPSSEQEWLDQCYCHIRNMMLQGALSTSIGIDSASPLRGRVAQALRNAGYTVDTFPNRSLVISWKGVS